jgi:enoyl-[acyl-carrier protein] reductase III
MNPDSSNPQSAIRNPHSPRFAGKVALVTGSSRGIGRAIALRLAQEGADMVIHYRRQTPAAQETAAAVAALGRRTLVVQADLGEAVAVRRMFAQITETFGVLDIFVANAAATAFKPLLEVQEHHLDKTLSITLKAFVLAAQLAAPLMHGRQGKIVTVSGIDARRYIPLHGVLAAAKGALEVLTTYLACELAPRGITVNGVNPGLVDTDSAHVFGEEIYRLLAQNIVAYTPLRRVGTPDDIAKVVAFLCSDEAAWICGQTLTVDGGLSLTSPFDIRHLLASGDA